MRNIFIVSMLILAACQTAIADFAGPSLACNAMSPDGNIVVRITTISWNPPDHKVAYYKFQEETGTFVRDGSFSLTSPPAEMLFVSDAGDLAIVALSEFEAIRLYSKEGKLIKAWKLDQILSKHEINACAMTGATLQWLEEGSFQDRNFFFRGPSSLIRSLGGPFTVMRGMNDKVRFSGIISAADGEIWKYDEESEESSFKWKRTPAKPRVSTGGKATESQSSPR